MLWKQNGIVFLPKLSDSLAAWRILELLGAWSVTLLTKSAARLSSLEGQRTYESKNCGHALTLG
jgi:hypothetical protein